MDVGECNGRRLCAGLALDYKLRLWAPTSASRAVSAVAELLVLNGIAELVYAQNMFVIVFVLNSTINM